MNRFGTLAIIALLLLTVACTATAASHSGFFFIQLTDPQLGFTNKSQDTAPDAAHFKKAVEHINRLKPAFVVITGDMTHAVRDPKEAREFWTIAREIRPDVPLYLLPGNHDVAKATAEDVRAYERIYGKDHYSLSYDGSEFIMLNSEVISENSDKDLREAQLKWFETELADARAKNATHIFVCSHQPWFLKSPDEPDAYQNVPLAYRGAYLDLMNRYGVEYSLLGHLHHEQIGHYNGLTLLTAGPLSKSVANPPVVGFTIIRVYKDRVEHQFYDLDKIPETVTM